MKGSNMKKRLLTIIGVILMAAALFTVIHFIWSDLYIAEFDADNAETAIWGRVTLETGKLLDPDFQDYTQLVPVGGNLFFAPFVKALGVGITALRAGYTVLAVVFAALLVFVLWSCLDSINLAMIGGGLIMILTAATEPLRDILWAHSVYYSVAVYFILMCIGSLALYLRGKRVFGGILFFLSALLGSINGSVVLLYTVLPLAAAFFFESMNREHSDEGSMKGPLALICAAVVCGVALNKVITSGIRCAYPDYYTQFVPISQWLENLRLLPERWLRLFLDLPDANSPVMSSVGFKFALRLGTAIVLSVLPFFSFGMLKERKSRLTRIVILYHWFLCAAVLFFFVFGMISDVSWRLMPLYLSCLIVDWLTMLRLLKRKGYLRPVGTVSLCLLALFAGLTAVSVTRKPADLSVWYGDDCIYQILEKNGLTHGYSTDFWYTNSITVLSDSRINVLGITAADDGFKTADFMNKGSWYKETPTEEETFLICYERDFREKFPWLEEDAAEVLYATQYTPRYGFTGSWVILVFDRDVFAEELQ